MTATPKSELMRRLRERRKKAGYVKRVAYIKPEDVERHRNYVVKRLGGEVGG